MWDNLIGNLRLLRARRALLKFGKTFELLKLQCRSHSVLCQNTKFLGDFTRYKYNLKLWWKNKWQYQFLRSYHGSADKDLGLSTIRSLALVFRMGNEHYYHCLVPQKGLKAKVLYRWIWMKFHQSFKKCSILTPDIRKQHQTSFKNQFKRHTKVQWNMATRGSYVHNSMVAFFWASRKC